MKAEIGLVRAKTSKAIEDREKQQCDDSEQGLRIKSIDDQA